VVIEWLVIEWLSDEEMRSAFDAVPAPCILHVLALLAHAREETARRWLLEIQRRKCAALLEELRTFIRRHDPRFHGEGFGPEGDFYLRAVTLLAGKMDVL